MERVPWTSKTFPQSIYCLQVSSPLPTLQTLLLKDLSNPCLEHTVILFILQHRFNTSRKRSIYFHMPPNLQAFTHYGTQIRQSTMRQHVSKTALHLVASMNEPTATRCVQTAYGRGSSIAYKVNKKTPVGENAHWCTQGGTNWAQMHSREMKIYQLEWNTCSSPTRPHESTL